MNKTVLIKTKESAIYGITYKFFFSSKETVQEKLAQPPPQISLGIHFFEGQEIVQGDFSSGA